MRLEAAVPFTSNGACPVADGWLGTRPLFALVGAGVGGFGGFMSI